MKIAVLGAGAWGTALAVAFAARHAVALWARDAGKARALARTRENPYLPGVRLPSAIDVGEDLAAALAGADLALVATPTAALRETATAVAALARVPVAWACKGFEAGSAKLPHEVVAEVLGAGAPCGALSGPSFAIEVARGLPTAVTFAAHDAAFARATALALHQSTFRVYFTTDLVGVEVGGAVKNVMAIATGICDGLGLGLNARAALVTRGLAEITRLGVALGGRTETFMGLAGVGDLILTATGDLSRNRSVGIALGKGQALDAILADLGHVAEGVHTAREVERLAGARGIDMPITAAVCDVLFRGVRARDAVQELLAREPRGEEA
ncbi:MAG: NAD(P)-dependent glycerol-3-phosphate dehydrogenase [Burkholderiales bacterium]|nr:NAD(P)-dependent glycerol-3-phosphate dehydrogenase [Burkholderiales bacterium]